MAPNERNTAHTLKALPGVATALSLGLMTGFFFAFSNPTMMGFAAIDPAVFVTAMQAINVAVRNAPFFVAFAAPLPLALLALLLARPRWPWALAFLCYAAAIFITRNVNIPINDAMALWNPAAPPADWEAMRNRWTEANHLRGALTGLGFILATWGVRCGR